MLACGLRLQLLLSPGIVDLHLDNTTNSSSDADYLAHFNVPGVERAGGFPMAVTAGCGEQVIDG